MYLEDYAIGREFRFGPVTVSESEIVDFGRQFDPQPFHVDPVAAANGPFGGVIASGWHTCGLTMRLLVEGFFDDASSLGSPGIDELRFPRPVRPGDRLDVHVTVLENRRSTSKPDRGIIRSHVETTNQDGLAVLTFTALNLIRAAP